MPHATSSDDVGTSTCRSPAILADEVDTVPLELEDAESLSDNASEVSDASTVLSLLAWRRSGWSSPNDIRSRFSKLAEGEHKPTKRPGIARRISGSQVPSQVTRSVAS